MDHVKTLNEYYQKLHNEKTQIIEYLESNEYSFVVGYYPFHSFKKDNEFYLEQYPIPVLSVAGKLDIGIDIEHMFFEFRFDREMAVDFDFHLFENYQFEVYGIEDYYDDYYFDDIDQINDNIRESNELEIGISILINKETIVEDTKDILDLLESII